MKKLIVISISLLVLTACNVDKVEDYSYEEMIDKVLLAERHSGNENFEGYKLYLPKGVIVLEKNDLNTELFFNGNKMYLYIDTLSYYYKEEIEYDLDETLFFAKDFDSGFRKGYLEIDKQDNFYYYTYMYNYGKIEGACSEKDIKQCLYKASLILASVKYNDVIIASFINDSTVAYGEKAYDFFKSNAKSNSKSMATLDYTGYTGDNESDDNGLVEEDFISRTEDID